MNKAGLIASISEQMDISKIKSAEIINIVVETIKAGARNDGECVIPGLGKLKQVDVPERSGVAMGKPWTKAAHKTLKLKLSKDAE
mgnify:CR=1 FL=1